LAIYTHSLEVIMTCLTPSSNRNIAASLLTLIDLFLVRFEIRGDHLRPLVYTSRYMYIKYSKCDSMDSTTISNSNRTIPALSIHLAPALQTQSDGAWIKPLCVNHLKALLAEIRIFAPGRLLVHPSHHLISSAKTQSITHFFTTSTPRISG
jgi:hypothetical protein